MKKREVLKLVLEAMQGMGIELSKINIQKIIFFLEDVDVPVYFKYDVYLYGPYSHELQEELDDMVFWDELEKEDNSKYKIEPDPTGTQEENKIDTELQDKIKESIRDFSEIVDGSFSFDNVEIAGTLLYCIRALENYDIEPDKENVIEEFKKWKGSKYPTNKIETIYKKITDKGLIRNTAD